MAETNQRQTSSESSDYSGNLKPGLQQQLAYLWLKMTSNYPRLWTERNGEDFADENGKATSFARSWLQSLSELTSEEVREGFENLKYGYETFPPTPMEFVRHCKKWGAERVVDEIFDYINRSADDDFWWESASAFNVFKRLHYNQAQNETYAQIKQRILNLYNRLDLSDLDEVPPTKPVALPVKKPTKVEKSKSNFQGKMFFAIMRSRPDLLGVEPCAKTKALFTHHKSMELMQRWYEQKKPDMVQFLRDEGIEV